MVVKMKTDFCGSLSDKLPKLGPKKSAMFHLYSTRLQNCKSADELVKISREIASRSFKADEKTALMIACCFFAKQFDKKGQVVHEDSSMGDSDQT